MGKMLWSKIEKYEEKDLAGMDQDGYFIYDDNTVFRIKYLNNNIILPFLAS